MKLGALFSFAAISADGNKEIPIEIKQQLNSGEHERQKRSCDKTVLGPALIFTKDRLENMISVSSGWSSESRLLDDDKTTYW